MCSKSLEIIKAMKAANALMPAVSAAPTQNRAVSIRPLRLVRAAVAGSRTSSDSVLKVDVVMMIEFLS
jgi:hypothetical protein